MAPCGGGPGGKGIIGWVGSRFVWVDVVYDSISYEGPVRAGGGEVEVGF